jgi:hypothetical protein
MNRIGNDEIDGACSTHGDTRNAHEVLLGKPERKQNLGD